MKKDNKGITSIISIYESFLSTQKSKDKFVKLKADIMGCNLKDEEKSVAFLSAIYYKIVKPLKGEHALFLEQNLRKELKKNPPKFSVPNYINDAITKVLE